MKFRFVRFIISGLLLSGLLCACNKDNDDDEAENSLADVGSSSTIVTSFSLKPNIKLLNGLDSVFFSIDQVKAQIFNADSLPQGTDVRKLQVKIGAPSAAKGVEIIMPSRYTGNDTVIDYLKTPNDSINFSRGSVMLRISSPSGNEERVYMLKVNVHKMNPDSLQWDVKPAKLPSTLSPRAAAEKSVSFDDKFYCLTQNSEGTAQLAVTSAPLTGTWTRQDVELPHDAKVETFTATSEVLYILAGDKLYSSADGLNWSDTGTEGWTWLYGGYDADVIGAKGTEWEAYPSGAKGAIPAAMPVKGTSAMWTYNDEWFVAPQALLAGGVTASGEYCGDSWGFDGTTWGRLSSRTSLPAAEGITLFPYFTYRTGNNKFYVITKHSCWVALGGKTASGAINQKVYVSLDNGVTWREGSRSLQLPEVIGPRYGASVLLTDKNFGVAASRAVAPITQWDAPYVLLCGGYTSRGVLYDEVWTGVINRLTFKPLQ